MRLEIEDLERGVQMLRAEIAEIEDDPEVGDFHEAFERFCMVKYGLGNTAETVRTNETVRTGGGRDLGIDFYSVADSAYHIAQCKIPDADWLEAHPTGVRAYGTSVVDDPRDALEYLLGERQQSANEAVRRLFGLVTDDKNREEFSLTFYLIVLGRLNDRAVAAFSALRDRYQNTRIRVVLQEIDNLVDDLVRGRANEHSAITLDWKVYEARILRAQDYCYFLASAADLFRSFRDYGWRLFDLNVRYELRNSPVNGDIVRSLGTHRNRKLFHHFNNGVTIVTKNYSIRDNGHQIRLQSPQVVNGLQTVKSIYNAVTDKSPTLEELQSDCLVQVKVIKVESEDDAFVSAVVRATNNQNPMAPRNLRANGREQNALRSDFACMQPRWFYQTKESQWDSLSSERSRFFEQVVGHKPKDFRPDPSKRRGRVIDNQDAAKAWLASIGFADFAGDRVSHYFESPRLYDLAFMKRPTPDHWQRFSNTPDFQTDREATLESQQPRAIQYLLAYCLWLFCKYFIPSPATYREMGLSEGVASGRLHRSGGAIHSTQREQDDFLAMNHTYQTWRLMSNMKELLVETASYLLCRRYCSLSPEICESLLGQFDVASFQHSAEVREEAENARCAADLSSEAVFSRIYRCLHYACGQFWEENRSSLLSTSRLRTVLIKRDVAATFKRKVLELSDRTQLDVAWKVPGVTFIESLPSVPPMAL